MSRRSFRDTHRPAGSHGHFWSGCLCASRISQGMTKTSFQLLMRHRRRRDRGSPPHYVLMRTKRNDAAFLSDRFYFSFNCPRGVRTGFHGNAARTMGCWSSANWFPGLSCRRDEPVLPPRAHGHHTATPLFSPPSDLRVCVCVITTYRMFILRGLSILVAHRTHTHTHRH